MISSVPAGMLSQKAASVCVPDGLINAPAKRSPVEVFITNWCLPATWPWLSSLPIRLKVVGATGLLLESINSTRYAG
jgi:hypothetical protein